MADDYYSNDIKVIFIPAQLSPKETDLCSYVLEDMIIMLFN